MFGKKNNNPPPQFDSSTGRRIISDIVKTDSAARPSPKSENKERPKRMVPEKPPERPFFRAADEPPKRQKIQKLTRLLVFGSIIGFSLFAGFILMRIFASATVSITPRQETKTVDIALSANLKGTGDNIPLEVMNFEETIQKNGKASGVKNISSKASGVIAIFNTFSSQPQVLIRNTRFETPAGKIYRIDKSVTIPGAKIVNGKIEPSSIEATVYAEEAGEAYNGPPTDFTIPGFKGTPRYEKFFARSKTPLEGGFVGKTTIVTENDVLPLRISGQNELKDRIIKRSEKEKPEGFLLAEGASEIKFAGENVKPAIGDRGEQFQISLSGSFSGAMVRPGDVMLAVIKKTFPSENPSDIKIINFDKLSVKTNKVDFKKGEVLFKISGNPHFVWKFDENKIKEGLLVASAADRQKVFSSQPAIQRAEIIFQPSWWRLFPSNPEKLKIVEKINE